MSDLAVRVEGLGKRYTIGQPPRKRSLQEAFSESVQSIVKAFRPGTATPPTEYWALRDVNFDVRRGDAVGIIGRNGAGKSTLLKILSRITEPTSGRISLHGKVSSLLEVGTGFHPELTGRENIYLNGAILGMKKTEIRRRFDEIVDFAEVAQFLDTPVKRYSSGMYVRLAFAVAAHLEPDILIVDEVLAVGDFSFQKKCLGKMGQVVGEQGRTLLFVSHHTASVAQLCNKAVLLGGGQVLQAGPTREVISHYLKSPDSEDSQYNAAPETAKESFFLTAHCQNELGQIASQFAHDESITIFFRCQVNEWVSGTEVGIRFSDSQARPVFTSTYVNSANLNPLMESFSAKVRVPAGFLAPGRYTVNLVLHVPKVRFIDYQEDALAIQIVDAGSEMAAYEGADYGCVVSPCEWNLEERLTPN